MITVPAQGKNAREAKRQTLSTSEGRANFAEALGRANRKNTVIGFDRYGKLVAAVVSIDAVRMLAGRAEEVDPAVRGKIERMSRIVLHMTTLARAQPSGAVEEKQKGKRKRRKDKLRKGGARKKKSKAAAGKRHRKITQRI